MSEPTRQTPSSADTAHLFGPGEPPLSPDQALARLLDRRERQVAAMLAGMSSSEHPDEWRDMDRGVGRLSATLLAETELLIQALRETHPAVATRHGDKLVSFDDLIDAWMLKHDMEDRELAEKYGGELWRLLARRP